MSITSLDSHVVIACALNYSVEKLIGDWTDLKCYAIYAVVCKLQLLHSWII